MIDAEQGREGAVVGRFLGEQLVGVERADRGRLDRSPTGTATSARIAVLDARGELGASYVAESVIDTRFVGRVVRRAQVGSYDAVVPAITGRAWITGFHQLVIDPTDPLADGFKLPDTWGSGSFEGTLNP